MKLRLVKGIRSLLDSASIIVPTFLVLAIIACSEMQGTAQLEEPKNEKMVGANLWLQSSAAFAFLCKQAYENAGEAVVKLAASTDVLRMQRYL
ncbi:MAG: hypothetical protein ABJG78_14975 [Cyclobacteriaceae bacterium]